MIYRANRKNDLRIELLFNTDITNATFKYYTTSKSEYLLKTIDDGIVEIDDNTYIVSIDSFELGYLKNGQLKCDIEINTTDNEFTDGEYNHVFTQTLDIYVCDSNR